MLPASPSYIHSPPLTSTQPGPTTKSTHWAQAYNLWLNSRTSPHTRRAYASAWAAFQAYTGKLPWEVTRTDIVLWLDAQHSDGLSPSTISQHLAALLILFLRRPALL